MRNIFNVANEIEPGSSTWGAMCGLPSTPLDKSRRRERKQQERCFKNFNGDLLRDWSFIVDEVKMKNER
ncbi:CLUMA_CG013972, isoform A [Clunio marinus]|uniref:CLUMA_CG013972, isoform A n=1 Tax=Clunio marinus TaxID=568069 RepID=A0A1J1IKF9_9DIPT|nr:CLUMA_CG013972, isoform A [Clunio marinus]